MNIDNMYSSHDLFEEYRPEVPPQLNASIRNHAGGCEFGEDIGEGSDESTNLNVMHGGAHRTPDNIEEWDMINHQTDADQGEEGVAPHQLETLEAPTPGKHKLDIPGHGFIAFFDIFRALAQHKNCTCHGGVLSEECMSAANPAFFPDLPSPGSMIVEVSSGEQSLEASGYLTRSTSGYFTRSASPGTVVRLVGTVFDIPFEPPRVHHFRTRPLRLTPEEPLRREAPIEFPYASELDVSDEESGEEDD